MVAPTTSSLVDSARALAPQIRALRDESERSRQLPAVLVDAVREADLFRMWVPAALGGLEIDPVTFLHVIEEVSRADGAAGWNLMIGAGSNFILGLLPEPTAREIVAGNPNVITGGTLNPRGGRALITDGGYRLTGRWAFGSGVQQCDWLITGAIVFEGETPRRDGIGVPEIRHFAFPAADAEVIDTWHVAGLRGTGSNDIAVSELFVPAQRTVQLFTAPPEQPGPLYAFPIISLLAASVGAVPLGIARCAIDALAELAGSKTPTGAQSLLRERAAVQADVSRAEALLRSARALLFDTVAETWRRLNDGEGVSLDQRALLRLAAVNGAVASAQAVDLMYNAGGASSIYESCLLERCFRDVHTATQHVLVQPSGYELAGRVLLGLKPDIAPL